MALPAKKFADVVVARFSKKPPPPLTGGDDDGDEGPAPAAPLDDDGDEEGSANGKMALAASKRGDGAAFEEAVKAIVREVLDESGK